MSKLIDADKLIVEIERQKKYLSESKLDERGALIAYGIILSFITSLQQEQPEVQNGKFVFPKYLYARTKDNKTIDMSYAPQDMTAVEYIRNDFVEQEQPEADLEKEYKSYIESRKDDISGNAVTVNMKDLARHFYELGQSVMRERITNPEYNQNIIEKMKSEYPADELNTRKV